ncbi:MAG: hypothetical protein JW863_18775 [Chitinispirillaceae bacterium]|nr:hypothetical protein [Chitinispirillaceae bacterium]
MEQKTPDTQKDNRDRCPEGHPTEKNGRKTLIITTCGKCGKKIVFRAVDWECPHCGDAAHLAETVNCSMWSSTARCAKSPTSYRGEVLPTPKSPSS